MKDQALAQATAQIAKASALATATALVVKAFFDENTYTITYVVHDESTKRAAIIDSVLDYDCASGRTSYASADAVIAYVQHTELAVDWLLETHAHADHLSAAPYLQTKLGGKIGIGADITKVQQSFGGLFNEGEGFHRDGRDFDTLFQDGDGFHIGGIEVTVLHVPGHTPACIAYVIGGAAFVGDTMFMPDYGSARADFPGGDARQLYRSLRRILSLPAHTPLYMCHDYKAPGRDVYAWQTTVDAQLNANVHAHAGVSEDEFVAMRTARDKSLAMPKLLLPSVQVNMRAGHLPEAESNGVRYLKIPLDAL
jgi:glyoxylase-like metal-dependent hydrolase (beta-lactamase superfamily II)